MKIPLSIELIQKLEQYLQRKPYFEVNTILKILGEEVTNYSTSLNKGTDPIENNENQEELPLNVTN